MALTYSDGLAYCNSYPNSRWHSVDRAADHTDHRCRYCGAQVCFVHTESWPDTSIYYGRWISRITLTEWP